MDYIGILKLVCSIEKTIQESKSHELINGLRENLSLIEKKCKDITDFNKSKLISTIPMLITALKDYLTLTGQLKLLALNLAYENTNALINYGDSYQNILNSDEIDLCCCIGHWGKYILLSEEHSDKILKFNELEACFNKNIYIAGKLFDLELTCEQKTILKHLETRSLYKNRPKEIQDILINESLIELRNNIINHIKIKYEIRSIH